MIFVSVSRVTCQVVTLWPCDLVTLWACEFVTLWPCDVVTLWPCDLVIWCEALSSGVWSGANLPKGGPPVEGPETPLTKVFTHQIFTKSIIGNTYGNKFWWSFEWWRPHCLMWVILWPCDLVILWPCDIVTLWHCDLVTLWPCDLVTLWPCDLVTLWPRDLVTLWPCDLVTWRCDLVQ